MSRSTESIDTAPSVDEDDCEPLMLPKTVPPRCCSARLNLAVLMFLGLTVVYGLRVNLNVAMVAMVNNTNPPPATNSSNSSKHMCPLPGTNHTGTGFSRPDGVPVYPWDSETQGWLLGALFFGYLCTLIPGGYLAGHYGGTKFLGFGVLGTAALTLLTPLAAQRGPSWLFALRALEGFTQGVLHPSTMAIWARWAPPLERSRLMSFSGSGGIFGALLTLPLTSFICETLGWPAVFYLCGGAGCVWAVFWFALVSDDPRTHKRISEEEREYIIKSIGPQGTGHGWTVPLRSMVTSLPLWAIIIGQICANWGFYTLLNSIPAYMSNILHYDLESDGILSALPYLGGWLISSLSGVVADVLIERRVFSVTVTRKIFTSLGETHIEFCCHLARGNIDPKEPPVYEYVKFVGDFKFQNNVPTSSCNGLELTLPRTLQSSLEEQVCLIATVRLVTPQFLKDLCNVEDACDEFTSRHSLEWKFLFLDHRASPIIGYLPFEVLGTSGYDYYHVDDLELIAQCHRQLMQFGKGKSCYYRFLTKGQQWIWLQTHYYITYHQWNSKPEFIVCTHTVVSYAEVRAERRRAFGLEELSPPEIAPSSVKAQELYLDICSTLDPPRDRNSGAHSVSSHSSRKSSRTALSDSASANSYTEACTPSWQPSSIGTEKTSRLQPSSSKNLVQRQNSFDLVPQLSLPVSPTCSKHSSMQPAPSQPPQPSPLYQLPQPQLGVMTQLKEQLEERTRILQADIKTQQQELHDIKEKLHLANLQKQRSGPTKRPPMMMLQQPIHNDYGQEQPPQQQGPGRPGPQNQGSGVIRQHAAHPKPQACGAHSSSPHSLMRENSSPSAQPRIGRSGQVQAVSVPMQTNTSLTMPFYSNPMMFSQTNTRPLQDTNQRPSDNEFSQDGQLRMLLNQPMQTLVPTSSVSSQSSQCNMGLPQTIYTLEQQIIAPSFSMQQVNCNAVLVPSPVFTSPVMIPHNSFISHQSHSAYHPQQQAPRHSLQLQQPQQFFQMTQGLGSTSAFLHTTNVPQQSTVGYIQQQPTQQQQQQQQQQQRQYPHSQNQSASDFRNMLTR